MISELDEELWIITCSFLQKNAKLFLPFLCEGEHHIVPLRMNILCQMQSVFFSWRSLFREGPEELFRSHFYSRRNRSKDTFEKSEHTNALHGPRPL